MKHWFCLTDAETEIFNPPPGDDVDIFEDENGQTWARWDIGPNWQPLGHVPMPRTRLGWFCHHLMHGLMMRYPLHKLVGWSLWYSFVEPLHEGGEWPASDASADEDARGNRLTIRS